jgi:hypothetical protein
MDSTLTSGNRSLFAYCITDGALDGMSEEQRTAIIAAITKIKEAMLKEHPPTDSDRTHTNNIKIKEKYHFKF